MPIKLDRNYECAVGLNRIINMSFTWFNVNPSYDNQLIKYSSDNGSTFNDITFPAGVWNYTDFNSYIKDITKIVKDGANNNEYLITLEFDNTTFRVTVILANNYQLDLTTSNFNDLIGFDKKVLKSGNNIGPRVPNLSQDTDILNIHCDLINDSFVDGQDTDIIYSFSTSLLRPSYSFTIEPRRVTFNPTNKNSISSMMIKSARKIVYDTNNLHKVTFVKNVLEYSDDFGRSVAKNSLWYLDTVDSSVVNDNAGFAARKTLMTNTNNLLNVNVIIPLNRYSLFEELEGRMLVPMELQCNIDLQNDDELIYMNAGTDDGRVVINRFLLWVPKLIPKDSLYTEFIESYLKPSTWTYNREMNHVSSRRQNSGFFQISPSIDNVKTVFVYLQRARTDNAEQNPYIFDTFKLNAADANSSLSTCRLEYGNGVLYPEIEYDTESKVRIFNDVMSYAMRKNDYNSGTQLNMANYDSIYPVIYFDLNNQKERVTRDPKQLIFRYKLTADATAPFSVHAVVLYEEKIVVNKVGNELVIV